MPRKIKILFRRFAGMMITAAMTSMVLMADALMTIGTSAKIVLA